MVADAAVAAATVVGAVVVSVLELLLPHPVKQSTAINAQTARPDVIAVVLLIVVFFILITSFLKFIFVFCVFVSAVPIYYHIIF